MSKEQLYSDFCIDIINDYFFISHKVDARDKNNFIEVCKETAFDVINSELQDGIVVGIAGENYKDKYIDVYYTFTFKYISLIDFYEYELNELTEKEYIEFSLNNEISERILMN